MNSCYFSTEKERTLANVGHGLFTRVRRVLYLPSAVSAAALSTAAQTQSLYHV